jgi:Fe-S cluster assembly ATPase SufC
MAGAPSAPSLTNLPAASTSFIGRERELAEIQRQLAAAYLLTLTGPGGSGKSRLALRVAGEAAADFPGGVWWCDLAAVADPAYVVETVAAGLGLSEAPNRGALGAWLLNGLWVALHARRHL